MANLFKRLLLLGAVALAKWPISPVAASRESVQYDLRRLIPARLEGERRKLRTRCNFHDTDLVNREARIRQGRGNCGSTDLTHWGMGDGILWAINVPRISRPPVYLECNQAPQLLGMTVLDLLLAGLT